jgi:hypothetical protein
MGDTLNLPHGPEIARKRVGGMEEGTACAVLVRPSGADIGAAHQARGDDGCAGER